MAEEDQIGGIVGMVSATPEWLRTGIFGLVVWVAEFLRQARKDRKDIGERLLARMDQREIKLMDTVAVLEGRLAAEKDACDEKIERMRRRLEEFERLISVAGRNMAG